jgi:hypothetical protein
MRQFTGGLRQLGEFAAGEAEGARGREVGPAVTLWGAHSEWAGESDQAASHLERHEELLDALVRAWVRFEHLPGRTTPLADKSPAIWVPTDVGTSVTPPDSMESE